MNSEGLRKLIEAELTRRGWSYAELERRAGLGNGVISKVLRGERGLGRKTLAAIGEVLGIPPMTVLRAAGMVESTGGTADPRLDILHNLAAQLDGGDIDELIVLMEAKIRRRADRMEIEKMVAEIESLPPGQTDKIFSIIGDFLQSRGARRIR